MIDTCPCRCHHPSRDVPLTDKFHAATACTGCIDDHLVAWTGDPDKPFEPPKPYDPCDDGN